MLGRRIQYRCAGITLGRLGRLCREHRDVGDCDQQRITDYDCALYWGLSFAQKSNDMSRYAWTPVNFRSRRLLSLTFFNIKDDFALIALAAGTSDLVFVEQLINLYADALNNRQLVSLMISQSLLDESVVVPIVKGVSTRSFRRIIATTTSKSSSRAGSLSLHYIEPPLFHPLSHLFNTRRRPYLHS